MFGNQVLYSIRKVQKNKSISVNKLVSNYQRISNQHTEQKSKT